VQIEAKPSQELGEGATFVVFLGRGTVGTVRGGERGGGRKAVKGYGLTLLLGDPHGRAEKIVVELEGGKEGGGKGEGGT
jgi:hypothetical protein